MPNKVPNKTDDRKVLGIDPGYGRIGIAILEDKVMDPKLIYSECFETDSKLEQAERLLLISEKIKEIIKKYKPKKLGIESLIFSKNQKTAIKVAEARGVVLTEAARGGLEIFEINPNEIKLSVTGYGKSDKKQVIFMIEKIVKPKKTIKHDDEYDAIATALACTMKKKYVN